MTNQQALEALGMAERLLREAAEELKAAHTIGYLSEWDNGEPEVKAVYEEHIAAADGLAALSAAAPAVAHACCNSWFVSLPEGRQTVLRDDKWMLAHAAFEAGRAAATYASQPSAPQQGETAGAIRWTDGTRTLQQDVISAILDYAKSTPEDGETWDSWFEAAFDLVQSRVREVFEERAARAGAQAMPSDATAADWIQLRSALAMLMLGWAGRRSQDQTLDAADSLLDAATEPGMPLAILRSAPDWRTASAPAAVSAPSDAAKDAARYRWLREQGMLTEGSRHPQSWRCVALLADMGGEHADAAIDAAMLAAASQAPAAPFLDPDRARLDYLQEAGATVEILAGTPGHDFTFRVGGVYATRSGSIRAAIDLARATPKAGAQRETGGTDGQQT